MNKFSPKDHLSKNLEASISQTIEDTAKKLENAEGLEGADAVSGGQTVKEKDSIDRQNMTEEELFTFAEYDARDSEKMGYTVWQEAIWRHALNSGSEQTAPDRICGQESGTAPGALCISVW